MYFYNARSRDARENEQMDRQFRELWSDLMRRVFTPQVYFGMPGIDRAWLDTP